MNISLTLIPAIVLAAGVSGQASNYGPFSSTTRGHGFDTSAFGDFTGSGYQIAWRQSTAPNPYTDNHYDGLLPSPVATPEPTTLFLFGGALMAIGLIGRKGRT